MDGIGRVLNHDALAQHRSVIADQEAAVAGVILARAPDVDRAQRTVGVAGIEDRGIGGAHAIGDRVQDQGLTDPEVVDVILGWEHVRALAAAESVLGCIYLRCISDNQPPAA